MYNDPDEPTPPNTNPFEFDYIFGELLLSVEAEVDGGDVTILECRIGSEELDISRIGVRQTREFEYTSLENCIKVAAREYLEDAR